MAVPLLRASVCTAWTHNLKHLVVHIPAQRSSTCEFFYFIDF